MLFNVALFSSLFLVPAVLAAPSALGARIARRSEVRQAQLNNHLEQPSGAAYNTEYSGNWAGAVWSKGNVRNIFHGLRHRTHLYTTGNFHLCHWDVHRPHPIGRDRCCRRRLGWHRR